MNKILKKAISKLMPKGVFKEKLKLFYYKLGKASNVSYSLIEKDEKIYYETGYNDTIMYSKYPLYPVVHDFNFYQNFYKVKEADYVIDAGANVGTLSVFFSKLVGVKGKIFAFEPDKFNLEE